MEQEIMKKVNKQIRRGIIVIAIVGILFGSIAGVGAYQMSAKEINYTPSNNKWKVNNVSDAIDDLLFKKVSNNYSLDEQVVGTWIDGKPVYQKCIETTSPNLNSSKTIDVADLNIAKIVYLDGIIDCSVQQINANWSFAANDNSSALYYLETDAAIGQYLGSGAHLYANSPEVIIIQYTKTTD